MLIGSFIPQLAVLLVVWLIYCILQSDVPVVLLLLNIPPC
jgi:hypothetical protein